MPTPSWYALQHADAITSPSLLIDADRVTQNIQTAITLAGGADRLRPHVKTHKMAAVTELCLRAGITRFKCATPAEAGMLARANVPDALLAYPVVGPNMTRLLMLVQTYPATRFSCLIDSETSAQQLSTTFIDNPIDVYIDLNVGMNRTGILPADAPRLAAACANFPGLRLIGLHAYDGHVHDTDLPARTQHADAAYAQAETARQTIETAQSRPLTLIIGGTPTFAIHARRGAYQLQLGPGTFVFWDAGYAATLPDLPFQMAAVLLTRVISVVDDHTLTLDLGHKAVAAENPLPRVLFPDYPNARPVSQSEEHLVVHVPDALHHVPGEVWYAIPTHICPTVALYDTVQVVENGLVTGSWAVSRGR